MKSIGGNTNAQLQMKTGFIKNEIGEKIVKWETIHNLHGFLDYSSGEANNISYDAKVEESTHIFICDYVALDAKIKAENSRLIVNGAKYDITQIDNPMGLNYQLEISLKYTGGVVNE